MKKSTRLQEFVNKNYNGNYKKLALEVNEWHHSEVFKIYRSHGANRCAIAVWAEGNNKPTKLRWAWLLLKKYIREKFGIRVYDYWLTPREVEEQEPENNAPELFSEENQDGIKKDVCKLDEKLLKGASELFTEEEEKTIDDFAKENAKLALSSYADALDMIIEGLCILKSLMKI